MVDAGRTAAMPTGDWTRALGRVLLFMALFTAIVLVGALLLPATDELTSLALVGQTAVMLIGAVAAGTVLLRWLDGRPPGALGFGWHRAAPREIVVGAAIGFGAILAAVAMLVLAGRVQYGGDVGGIGDWSATLGADLAVFTVAAASEEAVFRGYPLQVLTRGFGAVPAVVATSVVFALAHGSNPNADSFALANLFLAGVLLAVAYLRTRSLWFATALHVGWNWGMASVLDLPVSGLEMMDTPLYEPVVAGPAWLSGGTFGPEGGLAGTFGFAIALVAVLRWPGIREADEMRAMRPLVDRNEE